MDLHGGDHTMKSVVFPIVALVFAEVLSAAQVSPAEKPNAVTLSPVKVQDGRLFDVLIAVRQANTNKVVFGFEDDRASEKASLKWQGGGEGQLLTELRQRYPGYRFEVLPNGVISIRPMVHYPGSNLLDLRVPHFEARGNRAVGDVIQHLDVEVPELRSLLYPAHAGKIGASTSGGMEPELRFSADNITVRELLNQLAAYSIELSNKASDQGKYLPPVSWHFTFRPDPQAGNAAGGYAHFETF